MDAVPSTLWQHDGAVLAARHWNEVALIGRSGTPEALPTICQAYWPPLYAFLRRRNQSPASAQVLIQAFFVSLLEPNSPSHLDHDRSRLRTFLLSSLHDFLARTSEPASVHPRGSRERISILQEHFAEVEAALRTAGDAEPACTYERTWAATLLDRAWAPVEAAVTAEGKSPWLRALKPLLLGGAGPIPASDRSGVQPAGQSAALQGLRQRYRKAFRAEVAGTVANTEDVAAEVRYLHRALTAQ